MNCKNQNDSLSERKRNDDSLNERKRLARVDAVKNIFMSLTFAHSSLSAHQSYITFSHASLNSTTHYIHVDF